MNKPRTKLLAAALTIGAMPLALSGTCNPYTGSLSVFRENYHNDYFVEDIFFDDYYYEDDCFFFDCGF